jgi:hypothetical protein
MITSFSLHQGIPPASSGTSQPLSFLFYGLTIQRSFAVPLVISAMQEDKALAALLSAIYGRTPNLHLVIAAQLSALRVTSGPYGPVNPFPVVCDMRDVRVSWGTILLSPTSWDSRSGVRSRIGQLKICPMSEFVVTLLAFQSLVHLNTESVMNRLQIMEQQTAHINASVKEGRRLSVQHNVLPKPSEPQIECIAALDSAGAPTSNDMDSDVALSPQDAPQCDAEVAAGSDELSALMTQFDQCRRNLSAATCSVLLLKSSTSPLTVKQQILLKRDEKALTELQKAMDSYQSHLFDRMRALVIEKNEALAAVQNYRSEIQSIHAARGQQQVQLESSHFGRVANVSNENSLSRLSQASAASESQDLPAFPIEIIDFELWSAGLFLQVWKPQKGTFHNGKLWTGSSYRSILERLQTCSPEKDMQHNFRCLDCVFDENTASFLGRQHVLKFMTQSDSKDHAFAFETASARDNFLARFKS